MGCKAVFIDRDGTINVNYGYVSSPENFDIYPGVAKGIKLLKDAGFKIIVVTNQSGIARGYYTEGDLKKLHEKMIKELLKEDAELDAIYYCPHHPDDNCNCRKPKTGLLEKAIHDFDIDIKDSFLIGDRMIDVEAGHKMGLKTVLVPEDKEKIKIEMKNSNVKADFVCGDFYSGVKSILGL